MKFELYHHFYMILMENEEITADKTPSLIQTFCKILMNKT